MPHFIVSNGYDIVTGDTVISLITRYGKKATPLVTAFVFISLVTRHTQRKKMTIKNFWVNNPLLFVVLSGQTRRVALTH